MKKKLSRLLISIPLLLGAASLTACDFFNNLIDYFNDSREAVVYARGLKLSQTTLTASLNNSYKLEPIFTPANTTNKKVTWSSSNPSVCTVEDGNVSAISVGTSTITATSEDGNFSATCDVTVVVKEITGLSLSKKTLSIRPGKSRTLNPVFSPSDCSDKQVTWSSSNESIITVDQNGVVTASASATDGASATIRVQSKNHPLFSDTCTVTVIESAGDIEKTEMTWDYIDYAKYNAYGSTYCPTKGDVKLLVIPVWFSDSQLKTGIATATRETVREDIRKAYFGSESETGWHSVKSFYENESTVDGENLLNLTGTVSEWYDCGETSSTYRIDNSANNSLTGSFVKEATNWYFNNHPSDSRQNYDSNNDGFIDAVMLIYAHPDFQAMGNDANYQNFWAYCHWVDSNKNISNPNPSAFFWASYDFMYGGTHKVGMYSGGDTSHCTIDAHTYIHEMGHVFGLDDYYDYSNQKNPSGCFSMQDYNIGGHDPFSLIAFGWAKPYIPTDSCEITLKPFQTNHDVILLTPEFNSYGSPFDEYILLEYYTPTGLNELDVHYKYRNSISGPNDYGIRVWHVDARVVAWFGPKKEDVDITSVSANLNMGRPVLQAFRNTYYSDDPYSNDYCSPLGSAYSEYNMLQLIRNNESAYVYKASKNLNYNESFAASDLFKANDTFTIQKFSKQFVKGNTNKLNSGLSLGFTFKVKSLTNNEAKIEISAE